MIGLKHRDTKILAGIGIVAYILISFYLITDSDIEGYQNRWIDSISSLEQNTLYGGQPRYAGIIVLVIGWIIKTIFGYSLLDTISKLLLVFVSFGIFLGMTFILKKETPDPSYLFSFLFFVTFIYYPLQGYLDVALATFFLLGGYMVLFYTSISHKEILAGLLFSLSYLSKMNTMYLILFCIVIYIFKQWKESRGWINRPVLKLTFATFIPLFILFLLKPLSIQYLILLPMKLMKINFTVLDAIKFICSPFQIFSNLYHLQIFVLFAVNIYIFLKYKNLLTMMCIPSFLTLISIVRVWRGLGDYHYFIPASLFLIMGVLIFLEKSRNVKSKKAGENHNILLKIMLLLIIILLMFKVIPLVKELPSSVILYKQPNDILLEFRKLIEEPLQHIPPQDGKVLMDDLMVLPNSNRTSELALFINETIVKNADFVPSAQQVYDTFLYDVDLVWVNEPEFNERIGASERIQQQQQLAREYQVKKTEEIDKNYWQKNYSLIIIAWIKTIYLLDIFNDYSYFGQGPIHSYHIVYAPWYYYPQSQSNEKFLRLFFSEQEDAQEMITFMVDYYTIHFEFICSQSERIANEIRELFIKKVGVIISSPCTSNQENFEFFEKPTNILTLRRSLVVILALSYSLFYYFFPKKGG